MNRPTQFHPSGGVRPASFRRRDLQGFTLVELLVVVTIISITTVIAIAVVLPAINNRRVSEAARVLQAQLALARDEAVRTNSVRGVRLLPDTTLLPTFIASNPNAPLAYDRMVNLQVPSVHNEGRITTDLRELGRALPLLGGQSILTSSFRPYILPPPGPLLNQIGARMIVIEKKSRYIPVAGGGRIAVPNPPVGWFGRVRLGDKLFIPATGRTYTIVGPLPNDHLSNNPEGLILARPAPFTNTNNPYEILDPTNPTRPPEFLILANGIDDNGNGLVDETVEPLTGTDSNSNNMIDESGEKEADPGGEWSYYTGNPIQDIFPTSVGLPFTSLALGLDTSPNGLTENEGYEYRIIRQPVPDVGSGEIVLPGSVVIDVTTSDRLYSQLPNNTPVDPRSLNQRSRLPINPNNLTIDILIAPNGQIYSYDFGPRLTTSVGPAQIGGLGSDAPPSDLPFYQFFLAEREDVLAPRNVNGFLVLTDSVPPLRRERRLVTINPRSGQVTSTVVADEDFQPVINPLAPPSPANPTVPLNAFLRSQRGERDVP
ncbi:hypothetical protein Isop_2825 [Isosphaera pallida ATCC 43644]|uniref:Prepilin-type N-terminal cleavage/methylation domain-containing protein n=1 Tax=Isosphaera pallida (strain ATCC 43644 / DSM 9630 / IS1B) TaxID=575540 RepID=E8R140_ISOPI|nr:prepilin-type N-terminal cleavage/methylation domain-containing protein [Isosphaera pallida]ADV63391.1 hypothetical protein Isop_2825 [Isosphaera pallida ATCC 43644]